MTMVRSREPEGPLTWAVMPLWMTVMDGAAAAGAAAGAEYPSGQRGAEYDGDNHWADYCLPTGEEKGGVKDVLC